MKTLRKCEGPWLWVAIAILTAMPAWADGEFDTTFGTNGVVKIPFSNVSSATLGAVAIVNGLIESAGFEAEYWTGSGCSSRFPNLLIVTLSPTGALVGNPLSVPQQSIECPTDLVIDPATGSIFAKGIQVTSSSDGLVVRFDATGAPTASYSLAQNSCGSRAYLDDQGRFVAVCDFRVEFGLEKFFAIRLSFQDGQLINDVQSTTFTLPHDMVNGPSVVVQDMSSGAYYVGGAGSGTNPLKKGGNVFRLSADSMSLDASYGDGGAAVFSATQVVVGGMTLDDSGGLVVGGDMLARLDPAGVPDAGFGNQGVVRPLSDSIIDLRTDGSRRAYALGSNSALLRFKSNGAPDATFSSSSNVQGLNGAGSNWQSMRFVDSSRSSVYLVGGAGCVVGACATTTAVIAKVTLASTVSAGTTTTVLNSSATAGPIGQSVTLTATVVGTNPTGTVTFKDGSATLITANLASESASYSTSTLSIGSHNLAAVYSGDGSNAASTSQLVAETITPAIPAVALASSAATIASGQPVTFMATVTGENPTGTVTFSDGSTTLETVNLTSGLASYNTSTLAVGTHSVSALYNGDSNNVARISAAVTETVMAQTSGGGQNGGGSSGGGGGAFSLWELCGMLLLGLWRTLSSRQLIVRG